MSKIHIILDCPPGAMRPNDVLENILASTQLELADFKIVSKSFGEWTFELSEDKKEIYQNKKEIYENCKDLIIIKIKDAYKNGLIRYAEW
jgi:hypothetical protein